jgi:predicted RNase H-like HicB family nuclease
MQACRILCTKSKQNLRPTARWIAEIVDVPGVMAYGASEKEAVASAQALALRIE